MFERRGCFMCAAPKKQSPYIIIALPYAGGSPQIYAPWQKDNAFKDPSGNPIDIWAVNYAGRGARFGDPFPPTISAVVTELLGEIAEHFPTQKIILYGHSLGGLVTFALARKLAPGSWDEGHRLAAVFIGGCRAPQIPPNPQGLAARVDELSDKEFLDGVKAMGGTPPEFWEHPELVAMYLPVLQADFRLAAAVLDVSGTDNKTSVPIHVYLGSDDGYTHGEHDVKWADASTREVVVEKIPGGHFFMQEDTGRLKLIASMNTVIASLK